MSNSSGIISETGVNLHSDVRTVLGETTENLPVICTSSKVNHYSRFRPGDWRIDTSNNLYYRQPAGGSGDPYMLGDFRLYNHHAYAPYVANPVMNEKLAADQAGQTKTITLYLTRQQAEELADVLLPVTDPLWHAPKGGEKLAFTVLGANGLSTLILWWLAIHQTQSYAPDAQTAALAQLGQLAAFAARWLPLGTAWLLVLAGTLFCISLVRSALQAVHYTVWRTDTQLGSRGGLVRRYEMRLRLCQLNYADLRRSPATWALHYCPVFVSAGACRPELPLFVWREGTPLLRELLPEMAQLPPDTRADTTDRSVVFFLPAGIPLALCLLLTAVSRTTLPALTLPLLIPTGVFAALLGAAAVGWHREGVWQQQGQLLLCRQHRFHLHQLCVFHPDTGFTALQSPWAVTVQRANLTLVFPGKEKVTVRSVPLAALDFLEI